MDPRMEPIMDPAVLISGAHGKKLQGSYMAQNDHFSLDRSLDNGQT